MGLLKGKRVLVTGAEQGIGNAIAKAFLGAGCDVFAHFFRSEEGSPKLVDLAHSLFCRADCFEADLTVESEVKECVRRAASFLGGLDILVNNVGGLLNRRLLAD